MPPDSAFTYGLINSVCAEAKDQLKNILMAAVDLLQLHYPA